MMDRLLSVRVARLTRPKPRGGACYLNAFHAFTALRTVGIDPLKCRYVEGWAGTDPEIAHGWIEAPDGRVIDVTPRMLEAPPDKYAPERRYTLDQVLDHLDQHGSTLPVQEPPRLARQRAADLQELAAELEGNPGV